MSQELRDKIRKLEALAASSKFEGERNNALAMAAKLRKRLGEEPQRAEPGSQANFERVQQAWGGSAFTFDHLREAMERVHRASAAAQPSQEPQSESARLTRLKNASSRMEIMEVLRAHSLIQIWQRRGHLEPAEWEQVDQLLAKYP